MIKTHYLQCIYDKAKFKLTREKTLEVVKQLVVDLPIDSLAFTGYSGAAMAYWLAAQLDLNLVCVRKENENSHYISNMKNYYNKDERTLVEGDVSGKNYLIIDDFITTGMTAEHVLREIKHLNTIDGIKSKLECKGLVMFAANQYYPGTWKELPVYRTGIE